MSAHGTTRLTKIPIRSGAIKARMLSKLGKPLSVSKSSNPVYGVKKQLQASYKRFAPDF
jgi:hypothetical protein